MFGRQYSQEIEDLRSSLQEKDQQVRDIILFTLLGVGISVATLKINYMQINDLEQELLRVRQFNVLYGCTNSP